VQENGVKTTLGSIWRVAHLVSRYGIVMNPWIKGDMDSEMGSHMRQRLNSLVVFVVSVTLVFTFGNVLANSPVANAARARPLYDIALVGSWSPSQKQNSRNIELGAKLAINQANSSGRLPFRLALVAYNTMDDPTHSVAVAREIITNRRVIAVLGPTTTVDVQAVEPILSRAHLAMVTPSAATPSLANSDWTNFFRVIPDNDVQGSADAHFLVKTVGARRLFVVQDGSAYGSSLGGVVALRANAAGVPTTTQLAPATTQCQVGTSDASQYLDVALKVLASQATALFYGGYYCDFGMLLNALADVGYHGVVMSGDGSDSSALMNIVASPSTLGGVYLSSLSEPSTNAVFARSFAALAHYSASMAMYAPESYDAANAIIHALGSVTTVTRPALLKALHHVSFNGVSGRIQFEANGNLKSTRAFLNQIQGSTITPVGLT